MPCGAFGALAIFPVPELPPSGGARSALCAGGSASFLPFLPPPWGRGAPMPRKPRRDTCARCHVACGCAPGSASRARPTTAKPCPCPTVPHGATAASTSARSTGTLAAARCTLPMMAIGAWCASNANTAACMHAHMRAVQPRRWSERTPVSAARHATRRRRRKGMQRLRHTCAGRWALVAPAPAPATDCSVFHADGIAQPCQRHAWLRPGAGALRRAGG